MVAGIRGDNGSVPTLVTVAIGDGQHGGAELGIVRHLVLLINGT